MGLFANPIYSLDGDYPDLVRTQVDKLSKAEGYYRSRLRKFTPEEIVNIKGKHSDVHVQVRQEVQFSGCLISAWGCSLEQIRFDKILQISLRVNGETQW